jgi:hypothetical protein
MYVKICIKQSFPQASSHNLLTTTTTTSNLILNQLSSQPHTHCNLSVSRLVSSPSAGASALAPSAPRSFSLQSVPHMRCMAHNNTNNTRPASSCASRLAWTGCAFALTLSRAFIPTLAARHVMGCADVRGCGLRHVHEHMSARGHVL